MTAPRVPIVPASDSQAQLWLPLERAADPHACGAKAANLGCMLRAGLPIPAGIVLTRHALDRFLRAGKLAERVQALEAGIDDADPSRLAEIEAQVRTWFDALPLPAPLVRQVQAAASELPGDGRLAVRSSAVGEDGARSSCAGVMDSVLGVARDGGLEHAIKRVWASRWSARALAYARRGHASLGAMAVIVQVQIEPRLAGVLFTRSPVPQQRHEMLCEYCEGLADRLVAGEITPARLAIARSSLAARHETAAPASVPALTGESVEALATAALAAERLFGMPQDIEWALDREDHLWLVQSRPITTAAAAERRRIVWSNANVNENFPEPISPLLYSVAAPGYSRYFANLGRAFGLAGGRMARMANDLAAIVGVHAGRLYYNLTAIHAVLREAPFGARLSAWFDEFTGAADPTDAAPARDRGFVRTLRDALELGRIAAKTAWQYLFIEHRVQRFEARVDAFAARSAPPNLQAMDLVALRDCLRGFVDIRLERWTDASLADAAAMVSYGLLKAVVARACAGADTTATHNALLQGLTGLRSAEPVGELWALAARVRNDADLAALFETASAGEIAERIGADPRFGQFDGAFRAYLERWGFRCSGELMLTVPSFQERPEDLLEIVRSYAAQADAAPEARLAEQRAARIDVTRTVIAAARRRRLLRALPWPSYADILRPVLRATQGSIALRERARLKQALLYSRLRRIALEIGARLASAGKLRARDDVFYLTVPELDELLSGTAMFPDAVTGLVALRRVEHSRFADERPPEVLIAAEGDYPRTAASAGAAAVGDEAMRGASVCGGVATGRARVLTDVAQTRELQSADILVTRQTDPGWAPAFVAIGALVLERGGMLSHGAILAREYGIPTVVGVAGATERINDGAAIRVDANRGEVHVLGVG